MKPGRWDAGKLEAGNGNRYTPPYAGDEVRNVGI